MHLSWKGVGSQTVFFSRWHLTLMSKVMRYSGENRVVFTEGETRQRSPIWFVHFSKPWLWNFHFSFSYYSLFLSSISCHSGRPMQSRIRQWQNVPVVSWDLSSGTSAAFVELLGGFWWHKHLNECWNFPCGAGRQAGGRAMHSGPFCLVVLWLACMVTVATVNVRSQHCAAMHPEQSLGTGHVHFVMKHFCFIFARKTF